MNALMSIDTTITPADRLRRDLNPGLMVSSHASSPLEHVDMIVHAYLVLEPDPIYVYIYGQVHYNESKCV